MRRGLISLAATAVTMLAAAGSASAQEPLPVNCAVTQWSITCSGVLPTGSSGEGDLVGVQAQDGGEISGHIAGTIVEGLSGNIAGNLGGTLGSREIGGALGGTTTQGSGGISGSLGQQTGELGHGDLCGSFFPLEQELIRGGIVGASDGESLQLTIGGTSGGETHSLVIDTRSDPPVRQADGRPCD